MAEDTRTDIIIRRIKNHRSLSVVVVAGVLLISVVTFAKALKEAGEILGYGFSHAASKTQYDDGTREALISAAHKVDLFFLKIQTSTTVPEFAEIQPQFVDIKADLRSILLRNQIRALNPKALTQGHFLLQQWGRVEAFLKEQQSKSLGTSEGGDKDTAGIYLMRDTLFQAFRIALQVEDQLIPRQ